MAELVVYGLFVFLYFLLVLHYLGGWLKHLFDANRAGYAVVALALIVTQGVVLEMLTTALIRVIRRRIP